MAVNIVTGMTGIEHITSHDDRARNASQFGRGKYVFNIGRKFSATAVDDNLVRIQDGMCINQGTQMGIEPNDYADVEIDNGLLGTNRHDIIVMRYEKNEETLLEKASLAVVKGVNSSEPVDPDITEGNILDGVDLVDDMPLYRVVIEGVNLVSVEPLFEVFDGDVGSILEELDNKVDKVTGKGLSTNDYTNEDKSKVDGIPTKTSDLTNDSDFVSDANYVHTDNNYTNADKEDVAKIEDLEHSLSTTSTATGNPISISDSAHVNAEELKVELEPIQDLHGYDKPWVGGAGKNKLSLVLADIKTYNTDGTWSGNVYTINSGTIEVLTDDADNVTGFKANGTFNDVTSFIVGKASLPANNYYYSGSDSGNYQTYQLNFYGNNGQPYIVNYTGDTSFTLSADNLLTCRLRIMSGVQLSNKMFYPMIRLATETDPTFEPYSNICPISGYDSTSVVVKDTAENPTVTNTYTLQFGDTVYGAEVDFVSGVATVDRAIVDLGTLSWAKSTASQNITRYSSTGLRSSAKKPATNATIANALCSEFLLASANDGYAGAKTDCITIDIAADVSVYPTASYADVTAFKTAMNGVQLVYELATPYTIQLTPQQIKMLKGNNVLTADGDMDLVYQTDSVVGDVKEWAENEFLPKNSATAQHNYSTQEQVVGTWIDGSTLYEKSWILSAPVTIVYNSWTSLGITYTGIDKIVYSEANNESVANVSVISDASNDDIRVMGFRNDSGVTVKYLTLRYTKTTE